MCWPTAFVARIHELVPVSVHDDEADKAGTVADTMAMVSGRPLVAGRHRSAARNGKIEMKLAIAILLCVLTLGGCSNLSPSQNTLLGGTAAGATGGAVLGAIAGNAGLGTLIGAGAGLLGGAIYNHVRDSEQQSYNRGYAAGQSDARSPQ
jgi:hypothetical protein